MAPFVAALFYLLAALAHVRGWRLRSWLAASGIAILTGAMLARGLRARHWPLTNQYEFALAFALGIAMASSVLTAGLSRRSSTVQATGLTLAAALVTYARLGVPTFKRAIQPLPLALDSVWLPLHVGSAALACGSLAVAGLAGIVWMVREGQSVEAGAYLERAIVAGYPLLTLSLIFGMIWAQVAWGRYWGWDLKELWTLITWLVYTLYWHLRKRPRWQGRATAWLAVAGLVAVLSTFLGTSWLARAVSLESLHLF
jgi:ABC-type transport system involved in cytochrome c biogenesis permease subunit